MVVQCLIMLRHASLSLHRPTFDVVMPPRAANTSGFHARPLSTQPHGLVFDTTPPTASLALALTATTSDCH